VTSVVSTELVPTTMTSKYSGLERDELSRSISPLPVLTAETEKAGKLTRTGYSI
jgi:hypothetical protein